MDTKTLGVVETQFADLIWQNEPIRSGDLVRLCEKKLNWKKSTTYTVLRKLCDRGIFQNEDGEVTSLISKEEFTGIQCERFVEDNLGGSLPAFIAAFTRRRKLSAEEVDKLYQLLDMGQKENP